jgi:hypothetical protein
MENSLILKLSKRFAFNLLIFLVICELFFTVAHLIITVIMPGFNWGPLNLLFNLDSESSIPTWFSSIQLFVAAVTLLIISSSAKYYKWFYLLAAVLILFLSFDEAAGIHETVSAYAKKNNVEILKSLMIGGHGAWIVPYIILGLLFLIFTARPIINIYRHYTKPFLYIFIGAFIVVIGFIGIEMLGYILVSEDAVISNPWQVALEELFEMLGVSIAIFGLIMLGDDIMLGEVASNKQPK